MAAISKSVLLVVLAAQLAAAVAAKAEQAEEVADDGLYDALPDFFPKRPCARTNKESSLGSCIRHNFQTLIPAIRKGGRLRLPSLEPYSVPEVRVDFGRGFVKFRATMANMTVSGLTDVIVRDARADLKEDSMELDVDLFFPKMSFRGAFEFEDGQFAHWRFTGKGPFEFTFSDINATWRLHGEKHRGGKYMSVLRLDPVYTVGGMKMKASGLVDGHPALDGVINDMVNRLWVEVVEIGKPFIREPLSNHLRQFSDDVFQSVPYDLIFPKES